MQTRRPSTLDSLLGGIASLVTNTRAGIATAITGAKRVFLSANGLTGEWAKISSDYISDVDWGLITNRGPLLDLVAGTPVALSVGAANASGSGAEIALANHVHQIVRGTPVAVGTANNQGTLTAFAGADHIHALPFAVLQSVLSGASSDIAINGVRITGSAAPQNGGDLANKTYVDSVAQGLATHNPVDAVVNAGISDLSGTTLTSADTTPLALTAGMRVFVISSANPSYIGMWVVQSGAWTRPADLPSGANARGAYFLVLNGDKYGGTSWVCTSSNDGNYIVGTSLLGWSQYNNATPQVLGGAGLVKTGNTLDVVCDDSSITVAPDAIRVNSVAWSKISGAPASYAPTAHAASHMPGQADAIPLPTNGNAGLCAPVNGQNKFWGSNGSGTACDWYAVTNAHISPTAAIAVAKLAARGDGQASFLYSQGGANVWASLGDVGLVGTNIVTVRKNGTHRTHRFHDEQSFVCSTDGDNPTVIQYEETEWKGDQAAPNVATWECQATVTVRIQYIDSASYIPIDRTYKAQLYYLRTGAAWGISGGTRLTETLGTPTGGVTLLVSLSGAHSGTINISIVQFPDMTNASDMVMFVDIEGGGNYES